MFDYRGVSVLIQGDCLLKLKELASDSVDSVITDPPAGISFMGKAWDDDKGGRKQWCAWMESVMKECLRVLKPGGHALVWAIPRTSHWTASAIEDAGFEIRDVVTHLFGSGFPKSLDISKAIDKEAGAERKVVGKYVHINHSERGDSNITEQVHRASGAPFESKKFTENDRVITAPSTDEAKQWQGFGTALKPAAEFWILARKPLSEKTVAKNVLKHGTGGLNIDASRISTNGEQLSISSANPNANFRTMAGEFKTIEREQHAQGRFPANLVLSGDAPEMLDEQSGALAPRGKYKKNKITEGDFGTFNGKHNNRDNDLSYGGSGGASRFFYCAKVSPSERNQGMKGHLSWDLEDLNAAMENLNQLLKDTSENTTLNLENIFLSIDLFGLKPSDPYQRHMTFIISTAIKLITELRTSNFLINSTTKESILAAIKTLEANGLSPAESAESVKAFQPNTINESMESLLGAVRAVLETLSRIRESAKQGNVHPTLKPQKLMTYLIKLITPPGGTVLDPFMGSGSTGLAAKNAGFSFIGIEQEQEYFEIATKRIGEHV